MSRIASAAVLLVLAWVIAHVLYLGPIRDATELTVTWGAVLAVASLLVGALAVLLGGLLLGRTGPAWLAFVRRARTAAAVLGSALVVVGLVHYRDTEPEGEVHWIVLGLAVLVVAAAVHLWLRRAERRTIG